MRNQAIFTTALSLMSLLLSTQARALDTVQEKSSVIEKTTTEGSPTIIQHVDSKMEPIVVQTRQVKDPDTGEKQKIVEPMIMERHDKVLDTTIIQPAVTEVRKTTEEVTNTQAASSVSTVHKSAKAKRSSAPRHIHIARKKSPTARKVALSTHRATTNVKQFTQTTEIERQPIVKETFIQNPQTSAPVEPQVIQKVDSQ